MFLYLISVENSQQICEYIYKNLYLSLLNAAIRKKNKTNG